MKISQFFNRISLLLHVICSIAGYFLIEAMSRHSLSEAWTFMTDKPVIFLYNAFFIFVSSLIVYLFRHRVFWRILVASIWLVLGLINGFLLLMRVTPFTGPDLLMVSDAMGVLKKYLPTAGVVLVLILAALLVIALIILLFKAPGYKGRIRYQYNIPLIILAWFLFVGCTGLLRNNRVLSTYFGNVAFAYQDYGYPYCLMTTLIDTGIGCPQDYSEEEIKRIEASEDGLPQTRSGDYPNIIFLQLESFFDPTLVNYLQLSEDPIPNFRKLMKEYSSGYYKVPSVGAGTCNTEFESITGMSLHYFGAGEYPYKSILKETTCESAPYVLRNLGYATHAIHNHEATFYGRKTVFKNLGFETFTSAEYMEREDEVTDMGWCKDSILTEEVIKCLDSTEDQPDYIFTISVQGHGSYPDEEILSDPQIKVSGCDTDSMNAQWEYYVNQLYEMDQFVKELTDALADYPEDVVLVMYGDHLPTMYLGVEDLKNKYLYQTQYVIWDNMGLKKQDENIAAYQAAATVMDRVGIHEGTIFRYHQARRNTKNYQVDLETLQYDILYGQRYSYGGENPFAPTNMRLGIDDVTLNSLSLISEDDYTYCLYGSNFTPSAQAKLNGEWVETIYVNPTKLLISGTQLDDFDRICVCIRSNSSARMALSKSYDRAVYALRSESIWKLPKLTPEDTAAESEEEAAEDQSAEESSAGDQSAEDQSAAESSAGDQSAEDQSAEESSAKDQSAEDQTTAEESSAGDQSDKDQTGQGKANLDIIRKLWSKLMP